VPSRVFGSPAWSPEGARPADHPLMEFASRLKTSQRTVPPAWVGDSTMPLALASTVWFSAPVAELASPERRSSPSSSSAFLQSFHRVNLAAVPQHGSSSHGLSCPPALASPASPLVRQGSTPAFVPPSGFGDPLDGFLLAKPGEPCFMLTALLGFAPSKRSPPTEGSTRCRADEPTCCLFSTFWRFLARR
jgi:hypothetical protein